MADMKNKKQKLSFSQIAPVWWNNIKEHGIENIYRELETEDGDYLNIFHAQYCIVGEAYDFYHNYASECNKCYDFAVDFDKVADNIECLQKFGRNEKYYWDKINLAKKNFNGIKKEFVNHWNEVHVNEQQ